jgi:hypothetical protein
MNSGQFSSDLVILTADLDMAEAIQGILSRRESLGIRAIRATFLKHPDHDPGCRNNAIPFVRQYRHSHAYALILFDREGCGRETSSREALEGQVEQELSRNGWQDRSAAVVLDPELEIWAWSRSPHVDRVLGWADRQPALREWLVQEGLMRSDAVKPHDPKLAMQRALRAVNKPWSSALHREIAERVSLHGCADPAFRKLLNLLATWFGKPTP